eukprot:g573.t1
MSNVSTSWGDITVFKLGIFKLSSLCYFQSLVREVLQRERERQWGRKSKHILILSHAGKPIFSRYGNEQQLSSITSLLQAVLAKTDGKLQCITCSRGKSRNNNRGHGRESYDRMLVFLCEGPLILVAISSTGETEAQLRRQLRFLYAQIISILTVKGTEVLYRNPGFDLRRLLMGTRSTLLRVVHTETPHSKYALREKRVEQYSHTKPSQRSLKNNNANKAAKKRTSVDNSNMPNARSTKKAHEPSLPSIMASRDGTLGQMLRATRCLPLPSTAQIHLLQTLKAAKFIDSKTTNLGGSKRLGRGNTKGKVCLTGLRYAILLAGADIVGVINDTQDPLSTIDMLVLTNFVNSMPALRSAESWSPLCLPQVASDSYFYAYIHFLQKLPSFGGDLILVLISADTSPEMFFALSQQRQKIVQELERTDTMDIIKAQAARQRQYYLRERIGGNANTTNNHPHGDNTNPHGSNDGDSSITHGDLDQQSRVKNGVPGDAQNTKAKMNGQSSENAMVKDTPKQLVEENNDTISGSEKKAVSSMKPIGSKPGVVGPNMAAVTSSQHRRKSTLLPAYHPSSLPITPKSLGLEDSGVLHFVFKRSGFGLNAPAKQLMPVHIDLGEEILDKLTKKERKKEAEEEERIQKEKANLGSEEHNYDQHGGGLSPTSSGFEHSRSDILYEDQQAMNNSVGVTTRKPKGGETDWMNRDGNRKTYRRMRRCKITRKGWGGTLGRNLGFDTFFATAMINEDSTTTGSFSSPFDSGFYKDSSDFCSPSPRSGSVTNRSGDGMSENKNYHMFWDHSTCKDIIRRYQALHSRLHEHTMEEGSLVQLTRDEQESVKERRETRALKEKKRKDEMKKKAKQRSRWGGIGLVGSSGSSSSSSSSSSSVRSGNQLSSRTASPTKNKGQNNKNSINGAVSVTYDAQDGGIVSRNKRRRDIKSSADKTISTSMSDESENINDGLQPGTSPQSSVSGDTSVTSTSPSRSGVSSADLYSVDANRSTSASRALKQGKGVDVSTNPLVKVPHRIVYEVSERDIALGFIRRDYELYVLLNRVGRHRGNEMGRAIDICKRIMAIITANPAWASFALSTFD